MRVLVAEDEAVSRTLLERLLRSWGYDVVACADGLSAIEHLFGAEPPQLAILDWLMPGLEGPEVCQQVREHLGRQAGARYVYLILLTALDRKIDLLTGLEAGADDFLTKPFVHDELRARLRSGERIVELEARLRSSQEDLRVQARRDHLTGLMNRGAIVEELEKELVRAARDGSSLGVVLMDLDRFKAVNDAHGHAAGDAVLVEAARRMRAGVRVYDHLGRWGGEEFLVVAARCTEPGTRVLAERIRQVVSAEPTPIPGGFLPITLSAGFLSLVPDGSEAAEGLLQAVDRALYRAKARGRNRIEAATPDEVGQTGRARERGAA